MPAAIARVRDRHPDTRVTFDEGTSEELAGRLASGELDLAIAYQDTTWPRAEPPGVKRHHLLHEEFMVALAPDHPLAAQHEVDLADLRDDDWTAALTDGVIVRACRAAGFEPRLVSITHDQLAIRGLVIRGLAVTLVAELLADPFKDLALRPIAGMTVARDVYALLPPGRRHPLVAPTLEALDEVAVGMRRVRCSRVLVRLGWPGPGHGARQSSRRASVTASTSWRSAGLKWTSPWAPSRSSCGAGADHHLAVEHRHQGVLVDLVLGEALARRQGEQDHPVGLVV